MEIITDKDILDDIRRLVDERRTVRGGHADHVGDPEAQVHRLKQIEAELDRCWDLLRQRRALRAAGGDPDRATARPARQVTAYRA